jgi:AraC-like DNA-binding protein
MNAIELNKISVLYFPLKWFIIAKNIQQLCYLTFIGFWYYRKSRNVSILKLNYIKRLWLNYFIAFLIIANVISLIFIQNSLFAFLKFNSFNPVTWLISSSVSLAPIYIGIFFFPSVLYSKIKKSSGIVSNYIAEYEQIEDLELAIKVYLGSQPHLKVDFTKSKFISDLRISDRLFTFYFNEYLKISFTEWKSNLRIDYANTLVKGGYLKNHTIESLALKVGFRSRNKFSDAFKNRIGFRPSEARN